MAETNTAPAARRLSKTQHGALTALAAGRSVCVGNRTRKVLTDRGLTVETEPNGPGRGWSLAITDAGRQAVAT